jgi:hypothetical protein
MFADQMAHIDPSDALKSGFKRMPTSYPGAFVVVPLPVQWREVEIC